MCLEHGIALDCTVFELFRSHAQSMTQHTAALAKARYIDTNFEKLSSEVLFQDGGMFGMEKRKCLQGAMNRIDGTSLVLHTILAFVCIPHPGCAGLKSQSRLLRKHSSAFEHLEYRVYKQYDTD